MDQFNRDFTEGVYQNDLGIYQTTWALSFQDNSGLPIKVGGELRDKPYFICRGKDQAKCTELGFTSPSKVSLD